MKNENDFESFDSIPISILIDEREETKFLCPVCNNFPNPHTAIEHAHCNRFFCDKCLDIDPNSICPSCSMSGPKWRIQEKNKILYRILLSYKIKCPTKGSCSWVGTWEKLEPHLKQCENIHVKCCFDCGTSQYRKFILTHQKEECLNRPVQCKNCKLLYQSKSLKIHEEKCDSLMKKITTCKYASCPFTGSHIEMLKHNETNAENHLKMAINGIRNLENQILFYEKEERKLWQKRYTEPCKVTVHKHLLYFHPEDNGWACDGKKINDEIGRAHV